MKKVFLLAATAAVMCSCEHIEIQDVENPMGGGNSLITKNFTFTVKGDFGNPEFTDGGGETRANQYMTADGNEMTDLWVIDYKDGKIVQQLHQSATDSDWGAPKMALTLGTHHIMFLASRGQNPTYTEGAVTWTRLNDTFYKDYEVTVVSTSNGNRAVTLDRVATRLTLTINDAIPSGTSTISIAPAEWNNGWNMLTGQPIAAQSYSVDFNITQGYWNTTDLNLNVWGTSTKEEWQTDVAVTSKSGNTANASVTITDAPFRANRTTRYTGNLYTAGSTESSVQLMADWLQEYEGVY